MAIQVKDGISPDIRVKMTQTLETVGGKVQDATATKTTLRDIFPVTQEGADLSSPSRYDKTVQIIAGEASEGDDYSSDEGSISTRTHGYTQGHKRCSKSYHYGYDEVELAADKGFELDSALGVAAKTAIYTKETEWAIEGTSDGSIKGLKSLPGVINYRSRETWAGQGYLNLLEEVKTILNLLAKGKYNMSLPSSLIRDLKTSYIEEIKSNVYTEISETLGLNIVENDALDFLGINLVYPNKGVSIIADSEVTQREPRLNDKDIYSIKMYTRFGGCRVTDYGSVAVLTGI